MWSIIPAAGQGTRIQPLAFSKELLPIGSQRRARDRRRSRRPPIMPVLRRTSRCRG